MFDLNFLWHKPPPLSLPPSLPNELIHVTDLIIPHRLRRVFFFLLQPQINSHIYGRQIKTWKMPAVWHA